MEGKRGMTADAELRMERVRMRVCISVYRMDEEVNEGRRVDSLFHPTSSDLHISIQVHIRRERE